MDALHWLRQPRFRMQRGYNLLRVLHPVSFCPGSICPTGSATGRTGFALDMSQHKVDNGPARARVACTRANIVSRMNGSSKHCSLLVKTLFYVDRGALIAGKCLENRNTFKVIAHIDYNIFTINYCKVIIVVKLKIINP